MENSSTVSSLPTEADNVKQPENEIGTQGLRKRIVRKGTSWQTPFLGDEVEVFYIGHVEGGPCLNPSDDKGTPFKFKLGQYEVIKGWEEGVATMKKGERAVFTIPPSLAYGEVGFPPLIPPNSNLIFDIEMVSWSTIRDLTNDGGVLKKVIREGDGWATPKDADEVLVKYTARLEDGTLVANCEEGVEFYVHEGHLCPAISIAVKTMRKGEKAELAVRFLYGIGSEVNDNAEIHNSVYNSPYLTIDIELISWKNLIEVTGDGKVLKKIRKAGEDFDRPTEGSLVKITYICKLQDGPEVERKGSSENPFEYVCLEEQVDESLDRAIMTMKKGEQALVTVHKDSEGAPEKSTLLYEVELIDFTKEKPSWKMGTTEKIEASERKKKDGNELFKAGKLWRASKKYEKASKYVEFDHSFSENEKKLARDLQLSCNLNNAACKLKMGEYLEASKLCTKVLELDSFSVKALFRRSQAYLRINELEKAEADIRRALTIDPNNRDVKLIKKELKQKQKEHNRSQAEIFGTMFSRIN